MPLLVPGTYQGICNQGERREVIFYYGWEFPFLGHFSRYELIPNGREHRE